MQSGNKELHKRSEAAIKNLEENGVPILCNIMPNGSIAKYVNLSGIFYRLIDGYVDNFTEELYVSAGGSLLREHLILCPNSIVLEEKYSQLKQEILLHLNNAMQITQLIETVLTLAMRYTRSAENFVITQNTEVEQIIKYANPSASQKKPAIAIDYFLQKHTGVCRHIALFLAYLIDRLKQDGILPPGETILRRDNIVGGAHTWLLFKADHLDDIYLIDSTWNDKPFLASRDQLILIELGYGRNNIDKFKLLFAERYKYKPTLFSKLRSIINNEIQGAHYAYGTYYEDNAFCFKLHFGADWNDVALRIYEFLRSKGLNGITLNFVRVPSRSEGAAVITINASAAKVFTNEFDMQQISPAQTK